MNFYFQLNISVLFLLISLILTALLWEGNAGLGHKALLVFINGFFIYLIISTLRNYSKVSFNKNVLNIRTLFGTRAYNLNDLLSWSEFTNDYRVRYRKITLVFKGEIVKIMSTADPINTDNLYHYLRTHYPDLANARVNNSN